MRKIRLGKTGLLVTRPAFGCLPIQRCGMDEAKAILRRAYEGGINYYDTANSYSDSEEKLGAALSDVRGDIIISTKSMGKTKAQVLEHIQLSMERLQTDYIDLFQFHLAQEVPHAEDPDGIYAAAVEAKNKGWIRHIGVTAHKLGVAFDLAESGLFETIQFPFSYVSGEKELALVHRCAQLDLGFIAMKGLAGGLITNARACHAFMEGYPNVAPIWGIQRMEELEQWLALAQENPQMDDALTKAIQADRAELAGGFCRGCGYCMPCPAGIEINNAARMNMLLRRSPWQPYMSEEWNEKMHRIENCLECGQCSSKCPYELDTPKLLKYMLKDYEQFRAEHLNLL